MNRDELQALMRDKNLTDPLERASFIHGFRTAEQMKEQEMKNQVEEVLQWFKLAVPEPDWSNKVVQIGCHFEEVAEMMQAMNYQSRDVQSSADGFKSFRDDEELASDYLAFEEFGKKEFLDSLCDQIVTAIGVAHMFGCDIVGALNEVNRSNFSKFVDGKPVFNAQGKISKPDSYNPPVLDAFLGDAK